MRILILALAFGGLIATDTSASIQPQKEVLVLYSTRRDARIVTVGDRELPRLLDKELPAGLDYYSEFLDESRFDREDYEAAFSEFLESKFRGRHFDLIIAMGEESLDFLGRNRDALFAGAPLVYFTNRADPPMPRYPNTTGVMAKSNLAGTVELATALQPDTRHLFVVVGNNMATMLDDARRQLRGFESKMVVTYLVGLPTRDLEAQLKTLPANSIVYYLVVDRDGAGELFHPLDYLDRVVANSNAPVYSWADSAMDHGIVGGNLKDQTEQMRVIARVAVRVLHGESAGSIPAMTADLGVPQVDARQLRRWGISESRVPAGTLIKFKQPSSWDRNAPYFAAAMIALVAQSALIGGLLIQRARRRRAEAQISSNEIELRQSYDRIRDLGQRLLHAQEAERSRIARDLHDDISQQMALLEIDLEQLAGTVGEDGETLMHETLIRAREIGRGVHDLSHRLHPAKLKLIGLVAALQGLRRELSHENLAIVFNHKSVPSAIPEELALCLFRVVQEALHNAIKHSQGHTVTVDLRGTPSGLAVAVVDDGVGFDVDAMWSKGIGLISMRERVEAAGGAFEVHSNPGGGTRIEAGVPLIRNADVIGDTSHAESA